MSFTRTVLLAAALPALVTAQALPKGATILDRNVEVSGGKAAFAAKKTQVIKGTMEMAAAGIKGTLTIYKAEPNLMFTETEIQGMGRMLEGFDGTHAWSYNPMQGPAVKQGDEKAFAERGARFHSEDWKQEFKSAETMGTETVEGEPCYKVVVTPHQGDPTTQFFSVKSGLLLKTLMKAKTAMGDIAVEATLKDYKKVGDILIPHTMVQSFAGQTMTMTFQSVAWNTAIPKEKFAPPAEVQALLKK